MHKRRSFWIIAAVCLLVVGVAGAMLKKPAPPAPVTPAAQAPQAIEFLPSDVVEVAPGELRRQLPLTGSLRPLNQVSVKAKVSGEVREVLVREGEAVKAGQVLVRMDAADYQARVEQAQGALRAAQGNLEIATKTRENNQALLAKGFISKNAFDNGESQFDIARANVDSARGALEVARKSLADTVIRAPISGLVSSRKVQPGEKVSADNQLLEVVDLTLMELEAAVPASDIMHVALGQEVDVQIEGMPASLVGKVARINPSTLPGSRSIMVYVQIDNPQGVLRAGMFAQAQLTLEKKANALTVPRTAIRHEAGASFVYAIEDGKLVRKPVRLGLEGDNGRDGMVEVLEGLAAGARIVRANLGNLREGSAVRIVQPGGAVASAAQTQ